MDVSVYPNEGALSPSPTLFVTAPTYTFFDASVIFLNDINDSIVLSAASKQNLQLPMKYINYDVFVSHKTHLKTMFTQAFTSILR